MTTTTQTAEQRIRAALVECSGAYPWLGKAGLADECHQAAIAELLAELDKARKSDSAKQAKIDGLMFEYCPEDMTTEQIDEWAKHQRPVSAELSAAIDSVIQQEQK